MARNELVSPTVMAQCLLINISQRIRHDHNLTIKSGGGMFNPLPINLVKHSLLYDFYLGTTDRVCGLSVFDQRVAGPISAEIADMIVYRVRDGIFYGMDAPALINAAEFSERCKESETKIEILFSNFYDPLHDYFKTVVQLNYGVLPAGETAFTIDEQYRRGRSGPFSPFAGWTTL